MLAILATSVFAQSAGNRTAAEQPRSQIAVVKGVGLEFLDWGGQGEVVLFLTALGGTARDFQPLALQFTDRFHVLGLTRRGQGQSDKPQGGYDTFSLVEDIRGFLDQKRISRATLVGYSIAGNELTEFATRYPQRVTKLVYLDAAYNLAENAELGRKAQLNLPFMPGADKATLELIARSNEYSPDYSRITVPALGFFVTYDEAPKSPMWDEATKAKLLAFWNNYGQAYRREQIDRFRRTMAGGHIVELHNTTHGGFVYEPEQQRILVSEMRTFLQGRH